MNTCYSKLMSFALIFAIIFVGYTSSNVEPHHRCLDTITHKTVPGPESELFSQCTPWKNVSCCTYNVTAKAHELSLYRFNFDHCPQKGKMSPECRKHFVQDLCFYECSPNIGPWTVKVPSMKTRKERFFKVPLCASECNEWFDACANDYTCTDNWMKNFVWDKEGNKCQPGAECLTFREVFQTAKNFCEKVWDGSWEVVSDDAPCMKIWFDGSKGNPNEAIARQKYLQQLKEQNEPSSGNLSTSFSALLLLVCYFTVASS